MRSSFLCKASTYFILAIATLAIFNIAGAVELSKEEIEKIFLQYDVDIEKTFTCQSAEIEAVICPTDAEKIACDDTQTIQDHCSAILGLTKEEAKNHLRATIEAGTNPYYGCIVYTMEHLFEPDNYIGCCNRKNCQNWTDEYELGDLEGGDGGDDDDDYYDPSEEKYYDDDDDEDYYYKDGEEL